MRIFTLSLLVFTIIFQSNAQSFDQLEQDAKAYIEANADNWDLETKDIQELQLVDAYTGSKSGVHHMYFIQRWNGTDIYNAITGIHFTPEGEIVHAAPKLYNRLEERIQTYSPSISAEDAVKAAARYMGVQDPQTQKMAALTNGVDQDVHTFSAGNISRKPIPARLVYQVDDNGNLRLAWDLSVDLIDHVDWLSVRIDATNGALLDEVNWTVMCQFGERHTHSSHCLKAASAPVESVSADGASYNVIPLPLESPLDGNREIVTDPADSAASPFGWHDTNQDPDPEFTTTRGNNAHAFTDRDANFIPDFQVDGGMDLTFDFPFDQSLEPEEYSAASTTNLFYVINMMHDIAYHYGFDEAAGNFQSTNYTGLGQGGDEVLGASQYDALGSSINNANFSTPPDGNNGSMRMFEFDNSAANQEFLEVIQPAEVRGLYAATTANFGEPISEPDVYSGNVAIAHDGLQVSTDACESITNGNELQGKVVMIDRGGCDFSFKVYQAQEEGAIAVIICNNQGGDLVGMAEGENGDDVEIPSILISREDCNELRIYAGNTLEVEIKEPAPPSGANRYDGSLDNGIIAHEYGHGISNRLTGGPSAAGCLGNDEQMGEGWSDFFTIATTTKEGDSGFDKKVIGNYALREGQDGRGFRNYPYSTDMNINPQTYEDIINTGSPHALGEVWASMLWDMYWAFVDEYGFDPNIKTGQGGNNIAIQLVIEGMAIQACNPGFVDGRDAILAADEALYSGDNQCLIWEVFARRGLGYSADQGSSGNRNDAKEAFDQPPFCSNNMDISKTVSPLIIERGDTFEVAIEINNYTADMQDNIVLTDIIPEGCTYINGSASIDPSEVTDQELKFELSALNPDGAHSITYSLLAPRDQASTWIEEQNFNTESDLATWDAGSFEGSDEFRWRENIGVDGTAAVMVENTAAENDQYFLNFQGHNISGEQPVLRFTHYYNTQPGTDGGIIEISTDGGITFEDAGALMFRNPYRGKLAYTTFAIVNQRAFWGDSEEFVTTYLDMSPYKGMENVLVRFRFGSVEDGAAEGWIIDDYHIFDMLNYNTEATVEYGNGQVSTTMAEERGTIVQPDATVAAKPAIVKKDGLQLFPNPAQYEVFVQVPESNEKAEFSLFDLNGKKILSGNVKAGNKVHQINTASISEGIYFIEMIQGNTLYSGKLILQ